MRVVVLPILFIIAVAAPSLAQACIPSDATPEWCAYKRAPVVLLPCDRQLGELLGVEAYVDHDHCQPECIFSIWVYQEDNGRFWLQRADEMRDDTCGGSIDPDLLII